ncbi:MAG: DNA repair protein RecO [Bacteroidia bacterium]|nr:DNA repair protein RecO [Bacteroidia bacterium]
MQIKTKAIVLRCTNYGDNKLITRLFTEEQGVQSFISTKSARSKNKYTPLLQPLSLLVIDYKQVPNKHLHSFSDVTMLHAYTSVHSNMVKLCIAQFISELLHKSLSENEHYATQFFSFMESSLIYFDITDQNFENFHLYFLIEFSRYLGFYPQIIDDNQTQYFDLLNGQFCNHSLNSAFMLNAPTSALLLSCLNLSITNFMTLKLTYNNRKQLLTAITDYYRIHVNGIEEFKTIGVLQTVLNA